MDTPRPGAEERVLVLMPTARDAGRTCAVLTEAGLGGTACVNLAALCREIPAGAGVVLLTDEAVTRDGGPLLAAALAGQPAWSDLPLVVLTRAGAEARQAPLRESANVTLVERPVRMRTLLSVVRAALRARRHQYRVRDLLAERHRAEEELRRKQAELTDFVENATIGLHWVGPDGTVLWANKAELDLLGYSREEYVGRNIAEFHADPPVIDDILCRLTAGEELHSYEARLRCKDGSVRHVLISSSVYREGGRFVHTRCFTRDITERRRAEERLRDEYRRKDEFMAMLAHELRNPLAPLRNALQILALRGTDTGVLDQVRGMMDRQVGHLGRLVDDLLDVTRIATGKVQLRKERLDLARLTRQQAADHRPSYEAKGVTLEVPTPDAPVWVSGDSTRLAQILDNLLTNALKFSARDGEVTVSVATDTEGRASVTVRDTGVGIEPEMLSRLFEPFSQADRTLDRSQGGLGLGLAIVRGLAELHGGSVRAESEGLGRGAAFTVTLPAFAEPPALTPQRSAPRRAARRLRVLVVEDNRDAADSLRMLLEAYGYEVEVAYSGPDGVKAAAEHRPEVVICDVGLPGMDGYRVAEALRGNPATAAARLIALTGYGRDEDRRRAREAGFDEHLTKPADPAALEAILTATS